MWKNMELNIIKLIICTGSFMFILFGIAGLLIGILVFSGELDVDNDAVAYTGFATTFVIMGLVLLVQAYMGFYGTLKESSSMLWLYYITMVIAIILSIIAHAVLAGGTSEAHVKKKMKAALDGYNKGVNQEYWEHTQEDFKCCGMKSYADWEKHGLSLPESCCQEDYSQESKREYAACKAFDKDLHYLREENCYEKVAQAATRLTVAIFVVVLILTFFEAITIDVVWELLTRIQRTYNEQ